MSLIQQGNQDVNDWYGPPSDSNGNINTVQPKSDLTCNQEWICEHRWRQIYNMVKFRNIAGNSPVENWWDNNSYQIAFSRGNKAFVVFNMQSGTGLSHHFQTGLPAGTYCDLVTGNMVNGRCTGNSITVDGSGGATITIDQRAEDPFVAIHVGAKH